MEKIFDCCVIGAGVVGASIFNKMTRIGKSCLMLDKASDVATGASKANSGLVHAGYDPEPNSLKAKLNVRGNHLYPEICKRLGVKLKKCGALVVGDDREKIEALYERGLQNGVKVEILNAEQIKEKVPVLNDSMTVALFAEDAYIVSPYLFTIALTDEGILNGGTVSLEEDITSVVKEAGFFVLKTKKNTYRAKILINSAGAGYNDVAEILGSEKYDLEFRRGEYFVFDKGVDLKVPCTIFPLPTKLGKGVLVTPTVDGNYLVGPTSEESDTLTKTTLSGLESVKEKSTTLMNLNFKNAIREFAGIRVICGDDFVIEKSKKVDGVINLAGICSPGLSSAPAIAEMVLELCGYANIELKNLKKIEPYVMFKNMSKQKQRQLLSEDKNYCQVVCKCEQITKGDIVFALNRPLKVHSVDAVKRRTNAGMGRCQGGFCFAKVVQNIANERNIKYEDVLKENRGSEVAVGDIREVK
ncbi:MAG: NAD(P)/FAD-dependent oxidoreductase [Candidatus Caccovivens sp.]